MRIILASLLVLVLVQAASAQTAVPASLSCEAREELDRLDGRRPVPLIPRMADHQKANMRDHLLAVQEIVTALSAGDFSAVGQASARIGTSPQMTQMCTHMGAGAAGFTDLALQFHRSADEIGDAAARHDRDAVTAALSRTLQLCNSCHATFRQQVVDEATWSSLTAMPAPSGPGPGERPHRGPGPHGGPPAP